MSTSTPPPVQSLPAVPAQPFRLDVPLHNFLQQRPNSSPPARAEHDPLALPSPAFPLHPELLHEIDAADVVAHEAVL
jgi:hypothetical protein